MKRLFPALLALCLLLCACNGADADTDTTTTAATTQATTEATTVPTTEATEVTEPAEVYTHPLTGETLDAPFTGRIVTFTINNIAAAMPQHGISQADVLYEVIVEGAATRCLAVFSDLSNVGPIGSVRSARTYFVSLTQAYDAVLVHSGKSAYAQNMLTKGGYDHVDADPSAFYRDSARQSAGYAYEHTHFTTGELISACLESKFDMTAPENAHYGFNFVEEQTLDGESAVSVTVNFGTGYAKNTRFTYNEDSNNYSAYQHGSEYIDGNTDMVLEFENILVLHAVRTNIAGAYGGNIRLELTGENTGYYISGGQMVPITWHRESEEAPFTYTLEDGSPLTMIPGKTYIGIVPAGSSVDCE